MGIFKKSPRPAPHDELAELRRSIQNRGQAKIPEATAYVDAFLDDLIAEVGDAGPAQRPWMRDKLRLFMIASWGNWFEILDRIPEGAQLRAEWQMLATHPDRFGPGELVAWWWHLDESLYRRLVAAHLAQMRGVLVDADQVRRAHDDYAADMVDWTTFFN